MLRRWSTRGPALPLGMLIASVGCGSPFVHVELVGAVYPKSVGSISLSLDVTMENRAASPRWFIFPDHSYSSDQTYFGAVTRGSVKELRGEGRVLVGEYDGDCRAGDGGVIGTHFKAVLLRAGARVRVRGLPVQALHRDRSAFVDVVIARDVSIRGEPMTRWFGEERLSDAVADVTYDTTHEKLRWSDPGECRDDATTVSVTVIEERRERVWLSLDG
jgi:hypothetical protein